LASVRIAEYSSTDFGEPNGKRCLELFDDESGEQNTSDPGSLVGREMRG
jgi:hypothetical protein